MAHIMSAAAPVGSIVFSILALLFMSLIVLLILRHYLPLRTTPASYLVPIFFALWLPLVAVILVPIDLASSAATDDEASRGVWLPHRVVLVSWRITYWLTFVLTWFILPILAEFSDSGYRDAADKIRYSFRENTQFYAIATAAGVIGFAYISIVYRLTFESLKALVVALAYCWGLFLAIYLMGHGLVSIPRQLIRSADISGRLRRLQRLAPKMNEQMEDSIIHLEEIEAEIAQLSRRKQGSAAGFQDWIEELQDLINLSPKPLTSTLPTTATHDRLIPNVITAKYLADLTRRVVRARHTRSRHVEAWGRLVQEAADTQAILDSASSRKLDFGPESPHASILDKVIVLTPSTRFLLHYYLIPYSKLIFGLFLTLASACIVWSEVVKFSLPHLSVIRLSVIHHWVGDKAQVGFAGQMISAFWICYMCAAALNSLTEVKVWRGRALVRRNTAYESAFWYATQVAKLCIPLSYNFMTFLTSEVYTKTTFYHFLGKLIDFTALGRWFDGIFPIVLLLPVAATLFGLYGKAKRLFVGIDLMEDEEGNASGYGTGSWREGRSLIERELGGNSLLQRRQEAVTRLASRNRPGERAAPVLSVPPAQDFQASSSQLPTSHIRSSINHREGTSSTRVSFAEDPADDNIFHILGHRMKNTIDTIEPPRWLQEIGQGIKKPKWMSSGDEQRPSPGGRSDSDIRRWFGGDGAIRL